MSAKFLVWHFVILCGVAPLGAQEQILPRPHPIPAGLTDLEERRDALLREADGLESDIQTHDANCKHVPKGSRAAVDCIEGGRQIKTRVDSYILRLHQFPQVARMTAKSWVNPAFISLLISIKGIALSLGPNAEPLHPSADSSRDDYKLYQTFVAEAEFRDGKVAKAKFLPGSLEIRAGKTFGLAQGLIYVKQSTISDWKGKESVTFTRTVVGRPSLLFAEPLASAQGFHDIYNTIAVDLKADEIHPHGYGSDFPSHRFWMNDTLLPEKRQVQPSDWFR